MHITKVSLVNYRNFRQATFEFKRGVNTVIGENGSGKTNLFRAIRLLLDENMVAQANHINEDDFHRGLGDWRGHWIVIKLEFGGKSDSETIQSLLAQNSSDDSDISTESGLVTYSLIFRPTRKIRDELAKVCNGDKEKLDEIRQTITINDYEVIYRGRGTADLTNKEIYKKLVGDFDNAIFPQTSESEKINIGSSINRYLSLTREFSFSYINALRDVQREFNRNQRNPLRSLLTLHSQTKEIQDFDSIITEVKKLNGQIQNRDDVINIRNDIRRTFKETVGETYAANSISIRSELSTEADELFRSLALYVGEQDDPYEGSLDELSLGSANLIFITLKLLEFQYKQFRKPIANFLVIEEPEAHIHTHIQKTLFDRLSYPQTQIIYSTHSPQISEVSAIDRVNVISRHHSEWRAYQPWHGLSSKEIVRAQRFLDAVRCNLLFARGVILVEGDAEEILIPNLIKSVYGIRLDEIGISLINIRSTAFENLAKIFHPDRIQKPCAIITDLDMAFIDLTEKDDDNKNLQRHCRRSQKTGEERKKRLDLFISDNDCIKAYYADHTFEVDFAKSGTENRELLRKLVSVIYSEAGKIDDIQRLLESTNLSEYGKGSLKLARKNGKGWFAILLAENISEDTIVPQYILDAIAFASGGMLPKSVWEHIANYRKFKSSIYDDTSETIVNIAPEEDRQLSMLVGAYLAQG